MFEWLKSRFRPTVIEVTFTPEENPDHLQLATDDMLTGINRWIKYDGDPDALAVFLHQLGDDVKRLHEPGHVKTSQALFAVDPRRGVR